MLLATEPYFAMKQYGKYGSCCKITCESDALFLLGQLFYAFIAIRKK